MQTFTRPAASKPASAAAAAAQPLKEQGSDSPAPAEASADPGLLRTLRHKLSRRSLVSLRKASARGSADLSAIPEDGFTPAVPSRSSSRPVGPGGQQPGLRHRASFRERFWTKPAANVFDDDDTLPGGPRPPPQQQQQQQKQKQKQHGGSKNWVLSSSSARSGQVWVPQHAASDFSRIAFPVVSATNGKDAERAGARIRPLSPIAAEADEEPTAVAEVGVGTDFNKAEIKGKGKEVAPEALPKLRRQPQRHSYTITAKTAPKKEAGDMSTVAQMPARPSPVALGVTSNSKPKIRDAQLPYGSDFQMFMAQARTEDRDNRARIWNSLGATPSATPSKASETTEGKAEAPSEQKAAPSAPRTKPLRRLASSTSISKMLGKPSQDKHDSGYESASPDGDGVSDGASGAQKSLRRQTSMTQKIAEYIRPPMVDVIYEEQAGKQATWTNGLRGEFTRGRTELAVKE